MAHPSRRREEATRRIRQTTRRAVLGIVCFLVAISDQSCSKSNQPTDAITITLIDQGWSSSDYQGRLNEVAAFMRNWSSGYMAARAPDSMVRDRFDIAALPRGSAGMTAATLGGAGYGVSAHSLHPREAAMFVRFLCGRNPQVTRLRNASEAPTISELYEDPEVLANNPHWPRVLEIFRKGIALRPSRQAGKMYPEVSRAYFEAVHAVLTRKESAAQAASELQDQLQQMLNASAVRANADLEQRR
jgi:ABC-type glycerol-3-phosphate transport system substrate-binding protein